MWRRRDGLGFPLGKVQKAVARTSNEDNRATGSLTFKQRNLYWKANCELEAKLSITSEQPTQLILRSIKISREPGLSR